MFLGTPEFAVPSLLALLDDGHRVERVYTQPDRPKGRGRQVAMSPVKVAALERGIPVEQPQRIKQAEVVDALHALGPDVMVVVGYGQLIAQNIIDIPRFGILNVHGSLLPKYRGAAPIQWAIANGETVTGVTTMQINAGLDTGDMLMRREMEIDPFETAPELAARMAKIGAAVLLETLDGLAAGRIAPQPQNDADATFAPILTKDHAKVDWSWSAKTIHNRARGFYPWPGAVTMLRGQPVRIWKTRPVEDLAVDFAAGTVLGNKGPLRVACGGGSVLEIVEGQLEGRKRVGGADLRNGLRLNEGERIGE